MLKVTLIASRGFKRPNHHLFSYLNSSLPMWQDRFCVGLTCDPQLMTEMLYYNLTACWFGLCTSKQHWITCYIWMAIWKASANELSGVASSPMLIPLEETTQTLYTISFLQECYVVSQCRLLVTVWLSNLINDSFFCCLGSLVRQTKLQCCQVCWWPPVMLAEQSALF